MEPINSVENSSAKILVVDDQESILFAIKRYLKNQGFQVECTGKLNEAETLMNDNSFAIAILDLCLSNNQATAGIELLKYARQHSPSTQVIIMTAYGSAEIESLAYQCGVTCFLHKPQPLPKIAQLVKELLAEDRS